MGPSEADSRRPGPGRGRAGLGASRTARELDGRATRSRHVPRGSLVDTLGHAWTRSRTRQGRPERIRRWPGSRPWAPLISPPSYGRAGAPSSPSPHHGQEDQWPGWCCGPRSGSAADAPPPGPSREVGSGSPPGSLWRAGWAISHSSRSTCESEEVVCAPCPGLPWDRRRWCWECADYSQGEPSSWNRACARRRWNL